VGLARRTGRISIAIFIGINDGHCRKGLGNCRVETQGLGTKLGAGGDTGRRRNALVLRSGCDPDDGGRCEAVPSQD